MVAKDGRGCQEQKSGSRAALRRVVEEAVEETPSGKLRLCIQKPFFEENRMKYSDNFAETEDVGITKLS